MSRKNKADDIIVLHYSATKLEFRLVNLLLYSNQTTTTFTVEPSPSAATRK